MQKNNDYLSLCPIYWSQSVMTEPIAAILLQRIKSAGQSRHAFCPLPQPLSHKWERGAKALLLNELRKRLL